MFWNPELDFALEKPDLDLGPLSTTAPPPPSGHMFDLPCRQPTVHRATREMVAVPRGVHRSLVNRYGPRTPAVVAGKPPPQDSNNYKAAQAPGESAARVSVGRGRGRGQGMALVGSSRPLLELASCTACAVLEEEMALAKSAEQKEVRAVRCGAVCSRAVGGVWCVSSGCVCWCPLLSSGCGCAPASLLVCDA